MMSVSQKRAVPPPAVQPALTASKNDLVRAYREQAMAVRSLQASVDMTPSTQIADYHDFDGIIVAQRPDNIRVVGQAPVIATDIFTMASDGQVFRIYIPSKNQFLVGPTHLEKEAQNPIYNLRPQHIVEALFWPELSEDASVLRQESELSANYYVLMFERPAEGGFELDRQVWFDRANLRISRIQIYGPEGQLTSDISFSDWQPLDEAAAGAPGAEEEAAPDSTAALFPHQIHIARPRQNYELTIQITKLSVNMPLPADDFTLPQPPGTELVQVGEGQ